MPNENIVVSFTFEHYLRKKLVDTVPHSHGPSCWGWICQGAQSEGLLDP